LSNGLRALAQYLAYVGRRQALKPLFVMDRMVGRNCAIATLDRTPVVVFRIAGFGKHGARWLEKIALTLGRTVYAILTTGPANVHEGSERSAQRYHLVAIEATDADIDSVMVLFNEYEINLMDFDQAVLSAQAAHGWYFAHYFATSVDSKVPISTQLASSDRVPAPAFSLYVKLKPIAKAQRSLRVSVDLFVCDDALMRISTLDVRLPDAHKIDFLQRLTFLDHGKLPFSAMLMRRPFGLSHRVTVPPSV